MNDLKRRRGAQLDLPDVALLRYANTPPTEEQEDRIARMLAARSGVQSVQVVSEHDPSLSGGFVVRCGNREYDWTDEGRTAQLYTVLNEDESVRDSAGQDNFLDAVRSRIDGFSVTAVPNEVGNVQFIGDGIARIKGIDHAFYGEIVEFEDGTRGMVQDIRKDSIGCILLGSCENISQSTPVTRTGTEASMPVGERFIGRVVNALGEPLDGLGEILVSGYRPVETPAPGIVDRAPVRESMETGILSIDTMFPIGRGQRELIIGDRQTGKTSIAIDAIMNQKGKNMICIYVAIGQKASTVAGIVERLRLSGAMEYSIVVSATAAEPAPMQYLAPYAGCAMADYFMYMGKDVLIVYDDLSKHATAYRAISLLLERPPGREAYPGDVFYLHSRLLERASRLSKEKGGGSVTALPIIETQAGDVSAYIPTNVISITDGQIFLESDLFFAGMRPAVNVGLSVSRVGSASQCRAMKKASSSIRIDLAQYREMAVFTQFASDLDEATARQLAHGAVMMELLKQPLGKPLKMYEQVLTMVAANAGVMDDLPVREVKAFQTGMLEYFVRHEKDIIKEIVDSADLTDELRAQIVKAAEEYKTIRDLEMAMSV